MGPIHRFRGELRAIASGKPYKTMTFRDADYWPTLSRELDAAVQVMNPERVRADGAEGSVPGGGIVLPSDNPQNPDAPIS